MMMRYKSHKEVFAGKIQGLHGQYDGSNPSSALTSVTVGGQQYEVPANFAARGMPAINDYLVRYADGYLSWSPAAAFEDGYTLVEDAMGGVVGESGPAFVLDEAPAETSESASAEGESSGAQPSGDVTLPIEAAKLGAKGFGSKSAEGESGTKPTDTTPGENPASSDTGTDDVEGAPV